MDTPGQDHHSTQLSVIANNTVISHTI